MGRRLFLREITLGSIACAAAMVPLCVPGCRKGESGADNLAGVDMGLRSPCLQYVI